MSLKGIRDAVQSSVDDISGLWVYDTVPDSINELPACWIIPSNGFYSDTFGNSMTHNLELTLLIARGGNLDEVQESLDDFIDFAGSNSIPTKIEETNLSTHGSTILVTSYTDYGGLEFAGTPFIGARINFAVTVD